MACIVRNCTNRFKPKNTIDTVTGQRITFHLLPKNENMALKWLKSLDRLDLLGHSNKWKRVCAKHFSVSDYMLSSHTRKLSLNAIPKISKSNAFRLEFNEEIPEDERRFYTKVYPTVDLVGERRVHCTVCNVHIGTAPAQESIIRMHPILKVTHCKKCHDFYNSGEFSKGEDGSELYCRWCGQGGEVYCCSKCPYVFCTNCIIQNLSKDCVNDIEENENWNCFVCAPKIMWHLRAQHWALMNSIEKQKQFILNKNFSESSIRKLMMKDMTTCCKKPKSGNVSDSSCDSERSLSRKRKSSTPSSMDKKIVRKATPKIENTVADEDPPEPKKIKSNDVVVCTPDVLGMLSQNNANKPADQASSGSSISEQERQRQQQQQRQIQVQQQQMQQLNPSSIIVPPPQIQMTKPHQPNPVAVSNQAPPLLVHNAQYRGMTPSAVPRKTVVGPRPPTAAPGQSPVYHTINGFRIDLNTAAQQETFRLPNGKLIQVKRQGTTAGSVGSTPGLLTHNNAGMPQINLNNNQLIRTQLNQLQSRGIQANTHTIINQQNQSHGPIQQYTLQQPHMATIRYAAASPQNLPTNTTITPSVANNHGNVLNHVMNGNGGSIATVAIRPTMQQPTLVKQIFASTPLGQARNQLQSQIFSSMDICQHLTGKIHTLTNSNAYKSARNYTDVKELYIHLSYLFTYAIGRFKTLQEKCMDDMRCLGFAGDAASLESGQLEKYASDNDEDDIVIVEPKTTLIDLDSDNDDDQSASAKLPTKPAVAAAIKLPVAPPGKLPIAPKLPTLANLSKTPPALAVKTSIAEKSFIPLNQSLNIPAIIRPVVPQAVPTTTAAIALQEEPPALVPVGEKLTGLESMECDLDITANFLAGMLDVELYEGTEAVQISNPPKKPRKKTTNKPNPHLIKQQQMQAREKEREMIKLDSKLKTPCSIQLERIDEVDEAARKKLAEYLENPIRVYSNKKKENGGTESSGSTNGDKENVKDIGEKENGAGNGNEENPEFLTIVETIDEEITGESSNKVTSGKEGKSQSETNAKEVSDKENDSSLPEPPANESSKAEKSSKVDESTSAGLDSNRDETSSNAQTSSDTQDTSTVEENCDENNDKVSDEASAEQDNSDESEQVEMLEVDESQDDDLIEPIPQSELAETSFEEDNEKMDVDDKESTDGEDKEIEEDKEQEEEKEKEDAEADSTTNNDSLETSNNPTKKAEIDEIIADNDECSNNSSKSTAATE